MIFAAITATAVFRSERQVTLAQGEEFTMAGYTLRYEGLEQRETSHVARLIARIGIFEGGRRIETLNPEKRFYIKPEQPTTEVAIWSRLATDLYLVLGSIDENSRKITLLAYLNPFINLLWWGGLVMAVGTGVAAWPSRQPVRASAYLTEPGSEQMAR